MAKRARRLLLLVPFGLWPFGVWATMTVQSRQHLLAGVRLRATDPLAAVRELATACGLSAPGNPYAPLAARALEEIREKPGGDPRVAALASAALEGAQRERPSPFSVPRHGFPAPWSAALAGICLLVWIGALGRMALGGATPRRLGLAGAAYVAWLSALYLA